ncbi:hypothetical protein [Acetobacter persici]|uniref:hypothetical protein n=1 Tax=Acetobacter persici TaxID=1076596 RepID=UPI0039EB83B6
MSRQRVCHVIHHETGIEILGDVIPDCRVEIDEVITLVCFLITVRARLFFSFSGLRLERPTASFSSCGKPSGFSVPGIWKVGGILVSYLRPNLAWFWAFIKDLVVRA